MDVTVKKRIYIAWALVVVAAVFDFGSSRATCVNGFVRECDGFDLVNIVCGIVIVALTFKYWKSLTDSYQSTLPAKLGVAFLDIVGVGVLVSGFDGNCICPRSF
ncbi:hypothetical protein AQPW35_16360 [Rubrivivax pictus]|uniref:Uncharacterized protein n=2 Tax=Pseudaquabacterium pictum TaxID=2315236 RepID=A0A480AS74_9BURK|nr:hypothetical protein AQPW35_16360 [Rubrivivax pictus]